MATRATEVTSVRRRLGRAFFRGGAAEIARELLGRVLVRRRETGERVSGVIVETEAYVGVRDRASHAYGGRRTARTECMFGMPGLSYVYFTYGMHYCFNVVCGEEGDPQAVLVRALEPTEGLDIQRLSRAPRAGPGVRDRDLCRGPARLCEALGIGREHNGLDLATSEVLWLEYGLGVAGRRVGRSARIGVGYAGEWAERRLRWFVRGNPYVSGKPNPAIPKGRNGPGPVPGGGLSRRTSQS